MDSTLRLNLKPQPGGAGLDIVYIGSHDTCDIVVVGDPLVLPRHCKVVRATHTNPVNGCPGIFEVHAFGLGGDVYLVRGGRLWLVDGWATLRAGDRIRIGRTELAWTGAAQ